jgi:hypothetical protein
MKKEKYIISCTGTYLNKTNEIIEDLTAEEYLLIKKISEKLDKKLNVSGGLLNVEKFCIENRFKEHKIAIIINTKKEFKKLITYIDSLKSDIYYDEDFHYKETPYFYIDNENGLDAFFEKKRAEEYGYEVYDFDEYFKLINN